MLNNYKIINPENIKAMDSSICHLTTKVILTLTLKPTVKLCKILKKLTKILGDCSERRVFFVIVATLLKLQFANTPN